MKNVSKAKAEATVRAIKKRYKHYFNFDPYSTNSNSGPKVLDFSGRGGVEIVWEEGPFEWALNASMGGVNEWGGEEKPVKMPKGVASEPVNSFVLALYREEDY